MEHKNILKIIEVYESSSAIYIISELLEGGTLF
jgi:serine/threonine protein kinase